jgi:glycosyltransferase involved in cell wall biosynthesis
MDRQHAVFFLAYHYPPVRSAGVERTAKFLRYLPEFGYRARVLTTSAFGGIRERQVTRAWEPLSTYRWLFNPGARGPDDDSRVRTGSGRVGGLVRRLLVPDGQVTWLPAALYRGLITLQRWPADLIYSTYPPASAHLLGWALKRCTGLPWVVDFRDAWTYDPLDPALRDSPRRLAAERRMERGVVGAADRIVAATEISAEYLRRSYPEAADRVLVIPNGFDPEDLGGLSREAPAMEDPMRLVHTGSFAASHPQRTPLPLFEALKALAAADPRWGRRLRLVLVGHLTPAEAKAAAPLERMGMVEVKGGLERHEALACQAGAHVLLLVDHARQGLASNVPGKFYEYLAWGRPIMALCGPGMVEQLMGQLKAGYQAPPDDPAAIARCLEEIYRGFRNRTLTGVEPSRVRPYHRRALAGDLAECFDGVLGAGDGDD